MRYIPADKLIAEIGKMKKNNPSHSGYLEVLQDFITERTKDEETLFVEPSPRFPYLDDIIEKVFGMGNLESWEYKEAEAVVVLAKNEVIEHLCAAIGTRPPYKDGNQWCILLGEDLQSGTCGFGGTIQDAFVDFLLSFTSMHLTLQEPEVNLDEEITYNPSYNPNYHDKMYLYQETLYKISTILSKYEDKDGSPLEQIRSIVINDTIDKMEKEPEVDLEKEIERRYDQAKWGYIDGLGSVCMDKKQFTRIARHFAEWGAKNAK